MTSARRGVRFFLKLTLDADRGRWGLGKNCQADIINKQPLVEKTHIFQVQK